MARPKLTDKQKAENAAKKEIKKFKGPGNASAIIKQTSKEVIFQTLSDIVTPQLEEGAIYNDSWPGFHEDYLVIHCLIKANQPKKVFEIGTNAGDGTNIICNAAPKAEVISLDISEEAHPGTKTGAYCTRPYAQIIGDSLKYDFSQHKDIDAFFIDGEHKYQNVKHESKAAVESGAKLIIWHDADIDEVWEGITEVLLKSDYKLYRVTGTRIAYALK